MAINLPLFFDENTPRPFIDPAIPWERNVYPEDPGLSWLLVFHSSQIPYDFFPEAKNGAALPNHIYMDAMGFGMGCCCLQVTFQACNVTEARRIYDALVPLAPIFVRSFRGSD